MRNTILHILLCLVTSIGLSQESKILTATIIDASTHMPLEGVHIELNSTQHGTTSNADGVFTLNDPPKTLAKATVLKLSFLGYETRLIASNRFKRMNDSKVTIPMKRLAFALEGVLLKTPPRVKKTIGHSAFTAASMGYWEGKEALGGEIASVITIKEAHTKLLNLSFRILQNRSDSLRIRVNFYEYDGGVPERTLVTEEIIHTISRKKGLETIDLTPYHIIANDDILVSIELLEAFGPRIYFSLSASAYGGISFIRERMRPNWTVQKTVCVGFMIQSSVPQKLNNGAITSGD